MSNYTYTIEYEGEAIATLRFPPSWLPTFGTLLVVKGTMYRCIGMDSYRILLTDAD
jgi:hypothetical protein